MTVYLLHFKQPLPRGVSARGKPLQAQHYLGWTADLIQRILDHADGRGARLTQVALERGIDFQLARVWDGADRKFERFLKTKYKRSPRLCPICNSNALQLMKEIKL